MGGKTIIVDFGKVAIGTEVKKYVNIINDTEKTQVYSVSVLYPSNNIDKAFQVTGETNAINPQRKFILEIIFKPLLPVQFFIDYYIIEDEDDNMFHLTIRGTSYGPKITLSENTLIYLLQDTYSQEREKSIQLINKSDVATTYQWYYKGSSQNSFQIIKGEAGGIKPKNSAMTTFRFNESIPGVFSAQLVCLILYQAPLFLNLVGSYTYLNKTIEDIVDFKIYDQYRYRKAFTYFMQNSLNYLKKIPKASVFPRSLDFGTAHMTDWTQNCPLTLSVTNHTKEDGYFEWITDPDNLFNVEPTCTTIKSTESSLFTVHFRPDESNRIFGFTLCGRFRSGHSCSGGKMKQQSWFRIPCIGNTWKKLGGWSQKFDVVRKVILPSTVPGVNAFTKFVLTNKENYPMLFKFNSPDKSSISLMPMCGVVDACSLQIICVALEPTLPGYYTESWQLDINNKINIQILFQGSAEFAKVQIATQECNPTANAMLAFPPTITNCTNYMETFFHNVTRNDVHVRVLNTVPWLGGDNQGLMRIQPNEIVLYHWWFFPKENNEMYETTVTCSCLCLMDEKIPSGEPSEIFLNIIGFSEYPKLKVGFRISSRIICQSFPVVPSDNNLNDILIGEFKVFKFTIFNVGTCVLPLNLHHELRQIDEKENMDNIEFDPRIVCLNPGEFSCIEVKIMPLSIGSKQINMLFSALLHIELDEIVDVNPDDNKLCTLYYHVVFPTLQVVNVVNIISPKMFSNFWSWKLLNIDALNWALNNVKPNQPLEVNMRVPEKCSNGTGVEYVIIMENLYHIPVPWCLRRHQMCACEKVEKKIGISFTKKVYVCSHRHLLEITPLNGIVTDENSLCLNMKAYYTNEGINRVAYIFNLPYDRVVRLVVSIETHPPNVAFLRPLKAYVKDTLSIVLDCGNVSIGTERGVIRIVWLYNSSKLAATWSSTTLSDRQHAIQLVREATTVLSGQYAPLEFSFLPTEMKLYERKICGLFGVQYGEIIVRGCGTLPQKRDIQHDLPHFIRDKYRVMAKKFIPVYLSHEHIHLPLMFTYSSITRKFSMTNSTDDLMRFVWSHMHVSNMIFATVTPSWGVMNPRTKLSFLLTIQSLRQAATFTFTINCQIYNLTQRRIYKRNEILKQLKMRQCREEFIIEESGFRHPDINEFEPFVNNIEGPERQNVTMSVSVSTMQHTEWNKLSMKEILEQQPPCEIYIKHDCGEMLRHFKFPLMMQLHTITIIDCIMWDIAHSKYLKHKWDLSVLEDIPFYSQLTDFPVENISQPLHYRMVAGICHTIIDNVTTEAMPLDK